MKTSISIYSSNGSQATVRGIHFPQFQPNLINITKPWFGRVADHRTGGHWHTYFGDRRRAEEMQDGLQLARREVGAVQFGSREHRWQN
ncbi:hypothetical protein L3X38_041915 [Prunus dulcis]|uniref:Uncharacterized protein n=1 Tax=Prunus dulcis TaxID=3755 RepID=A0AAD4YKQ6_PRUDU|nr:hypothetical protein L3X38_041915 [Prunus dulcis]